MTRKRNKKSAYLLAISLVQLLSQAAQADTPIGWISNGNRSAYTTDSRAVEVSGAILSVNGTIDFLNIREDLFANNRRLTGNSGDLIGNSLEVHYGVTDYLEIFARQRKHQMTVDLGTINSVNVVDIDNSLNTTQQEIGFKWALFQSNLLAPDNRQSTLAFELKGSRNYSDNFDVVADQINLSNLQIFFTDPTAFSVTNLEDDGWAARLYYSLPIEELGIATIWAGFGSSEATSSTGTDAINATIRSFFRQDFNLEENYLYLGASLNFGFSPRLPITLSYEFTDISKSSMSRDPIEPSPQLPGFLSSSNLPEQSNHHINARVSYWVTPEMTVSLSGNLYSNQFLGVLPHYNNPLSQSFSSLIYGFIGVELSYKLSN